MILAEKDKLKACNNPNPLPDMCSMLLTHFVTILTLRGKMKYHLYLPSQCIYTYINLTQLLGVILDVFTQDVFTVPLHMCMHTNE